MTIHSVHMNNNTPSISHVPSSPFHPVLPSDSFPMGHNSPSRQKGSLEEYVRESNAPPPFLLKTYMLLEDPETDEVISWNADGTAFVIWQPAEFARDLLPTLFKHSNFSSFVRQLNTYGFRKVVTGRWEFCNEMFRRGARELLCEIRRRKTWANIHNKPKRLRNPPPRSKQCNGHSSQKLGQHSEEDQRSLATSSTPEYGNLLQENKRLRRENGALNSELMRMRSKCKELVELVDKYAHRNEETILQGEEEEEKYKGPKLFGVTLLGVRGNGSSSATTTRDSMDRGITFLSQSFKYKN